METLPNICTSSHLFRTLLTHSHTLKLWHSRKTHLQLLNAIMFLCGEVQYVQSDCASCAIMDRRASKPCSIESIRHLRLNANCFRKHDDRSRGRTEGGVGVGAEHAACTATMSTSSCGRLRCGPCWLDGLCRRSELGQVQPELPLHSGERGHGQVVAAHVVFSHWREVGAYGRLGPRWVTGGGEGGQEDQEGSD